MQQNSFQKNGFLNVNNANGQSCNSGNFGCRSIESIRDDMLNAKTKKNNTNVQSNDYLNIGNNNFNNQINGNNHKQRVDNLRNFNRWK